MTIFKHIGTLVGVEVFVALPENPTEPAYSFCKFKGKPITTELVTFSRELWDDHDTLELCFIGSIGDGISVALQKQLITKE